MLSRVTTIEVCDVRPVSSVALTTIVLSPSVASGTWLAVNVPPDTVARRSPGCTMTLTVLVSVTVPVTSMVSKRVSVPDVGDVSVITGAEVSSVTVTLFSATLPAMSVAITRNVCEPSASVGNETCHASAVSVAGVSSTVTVAPCASTIVPCTTIGSADTSEPAVGATIVSAGCVRSTITLMVVVVELPTPSVATSRSVVGPSAVVSGVTRSNRPFVIVTG